MSRKGENNPNKSYEQCTANSQEAAGVALSSDPLYLPLAVGLGGRHPPSPKANHGPQLMLIDKFPMNALLRISSTVLPVHLWNATTPIPPFTLHLSIFCAVSQNPKS